MTEALELWQAVEAGRAAQAQVAENAGPDFATKARAFVLEYLAEHGSTNSEILTDACVAAGIVPHNTKAFGPVYASLSRQRLIISCGLAPRVRGHGSIGAHIWTLTQPPI